MQSVYGFGHDLIKGTEGCILKEKVVGETATYLLPLCSWARTVATLSDRQEELLLAWAPKALSACNGKTNPSVVKAPERNGLLARGMPNVLGRESFGGFCDF